MLPRLVLRCLAFGASLFAALCFGLAWIAADAPAFHALSLDERILVEHAQAFVDRTKSTTGQLPNRRAFFDWTMRMDKDGYRYEGTGFDYLVDPMSMSSPASLACFGPAPAGGFQFEFWDGDTFRSVASWRPGIACNESLSYLTGWHISPRVVLALVALAALMFALWCHVQADRHLRHPHPACRH